MLQFLDAFLIAQLLVFIIYFYIGNEISKVVNDESFWEIFTETNDFYLLALGFVVEIFIFFILLIANIVFLTTRYPYQITEFYTSNTFIYTFIITFIIGINVLLRVFKFKQFIWMYRFKKAEAKIEEIQERKEKIKNSIDSNESKDVVKMLEDKEEKIVHKLLYDTASDVIDSEERKELKKRLLKNN